MTEKSLPLLVHEAAVEVHNAYRDLLAVLPPGEKVTIPDSKSNLLKKRKEFAAIQMWEYDSSIAYIDFLMEQEKLGRVKFLPEAN